MTAIGHKDQTKAILENIERRAKTEIVREVELDPVELEALRRDFGQALKALASEVGSIKSVIHQIGVAAEKELSRK